MSNGQLVNLVESYGYKAFILGRDEILVRLDGRIVFSGDHSQVKEWIGE